MYKLQDNEPWDDYYVRKVYAYQEEYTNYAAVLAEGETSPPKLLGPYAIRICDELKKGNGSRELCTLKLRPEDARLLYEALADKFDPERIRLRQMRERIETPKTPE